MDLKRQIRRQQTKRVRFLPMLVASFSLLSAQVLCGPLEQAEAQAGLGKWGVCTKVSDDWGTLNAQGLDCNGGKRTQCAL